MRLYIRVCARSYFAFKSNWVCIIRRKNPIFRRKTGKRNRFYLLSGPSYSPPPPLPLSKRWSLAKFYYSEHGKRQSFMCSSSSSYNIIIQFIRYYVLLLLRKIVRLTNRHTRHFKNVKYITLYNILIYIIIR